MSAERSAVLVLESGRVFRGAALGARGEIFGEAVFNTSMTGYQEILTDPSYAGQIVVMTAAQIGNTGINLEDLESARPSCAGFAVREASPLTSSWRARGALDAYLAEHGVVGIEGIDTRALTRALRTGGAQRSAISTSAHSEHDVAALIDRVKESPGMEGLDLASQVTCAERHVWPVSERAWRAPDVAGVADPGDTAAGPGFHVVAYDFGIKHTILRDLTSAGCRVTVLPAQTPASEALALDADGFFLSNGPGDPAAVTYAIDAVRALVDSGKPVFGICLGHQILALALGATTYKLPFGHHGGNHPVKDLSTGKVAITAQNHGFAVAAGSLPRGLSCTHINLYDNTVEGIQMDGQPVFSVQYHPEAGPGPHDAEHLFGRFLDTMRNAR
jgi:carbamoyl-phosphate synthase small subunit